MVCIKYLSLAVVLFAPVLGLPQCIKNKPKAQTPSKTHARVRSSIRVTADRATHPYAYFVAFPYATKLLDDEDAKAMDTDYAGLPGGMAEYVRAIIFGKHGRVFGDPIVQDLVKQEGWYKPNPKFTNSMLNETERKNLDMVRGIEAHQHTRVMPGDLRYWEHRTIPDPLARGGTLFEYHIMHAEIEAIHGKRFDDEPLVQKYFEDRYWYKPVAHYDPKQLNDDEKANLALMAHLESAKSKSSLTPGSLIAFGEKPIKPDMLKGLNLYQLRLLRNEIYAIRGAQFHTQWIQDYFDGQDWYSPQPKDKQPQLTPLDERNVAVIVKREKQLHDALSTTKLKDADLTGMLSDDVGRLRNEIYARRGKVFKSKWLQSYFASMPWYKPDPRYNDKKLTPTERSNVALLAKYEKKATAQEDMTEG